MNIGELMPKLSLEEHHEYLEQEVSKQEKLRKYNRDFKEKISTDASWVTVVTKIDTRAVTSKIRKKVALNSGYTIDGAPVTYGTMLDGSEVHIDHVHARSKGGLTDEDNLIPKLAGDNLTKSDMNV